MVLTFQTLEKLIPDQQSGPRNGKDSKMTRASARARLGLRVTDESELFVPQRPDTSFSQVFIETCVVSE